MWTYIAKIASFSSPWIELIGERWQDPNNRLIDYWRTVSADSVIIIPIQNKQILVPDKTFRPGIGIETLDFPGGRFSHVDTIETSIEEILNRELGISINQIESISSIYSNPKYINSSTSNQKLFGYYANIRSCEENNFLPHFRFNLNQHDLNDLLSQLDCLQCRALLLESLKSNN
ncbi:hypothetical protein [Methylomonas sp. HYX-M1]|uniref:hypothetical protein n=1 Tax=Methylomonas sp. HYX-M1 TaxID=3139307 RepID=UPI00345C366A